VKLGDEEKKIKRNSKSNNIISFQQQQEVKEVTKGGLVKLRAAMDRGPELWGTSNGACRETGTRV
jgi:hypothetical protein